MISKYPVLSIILLALDIIIISFSYTLWHINIAAYNSGLTQNNTSSCVADYITIVDEVLRSTFDSSPNYF